MLRVSVLTILLAAVAAVVVDDATLDSFLQNPSELGKFFVSYPLHEGFRDVGCADVPSSFDSLAHKEALAEALACTSVFINEICITIFKPSNCKSSSYYSALWHLFR